MAALIGTYVDAASKSRFRPCLDWQLLFNLVPSCWPPSKRGVLFACTKYITEQKTPSEWSRTPPRPHNPCLPPLSRATEGRSAPILFFRRRTKSSPWVPSDTRSGSGATGSGPVGRRSTASSSFPAREMEGGSGSGYGGAYGYGDSHGYGGSDEEGDGDSNTVGGGGGAFDFFSQPTPVVSPPGGYGFNPNAAGGGFTSLDLNAGLAWPEMQDYEGFLRQPPPEPGIGSSRGQPTRIGSTLDVRPPRTGRGGRGRGGMPPMTSAAGLHLFSGVCGTGPPRRGRGRRSGVGIPAAGNVYSQQYPPTARQLQFQPQVKLPKSSLHCVVAILPYVVMCTCRVVMHCVGIECESRLD